MANKEKVRENRLRRVAERRGYVLKKSRRRDERAIDFGAYWIVEASSNTLLSPAAGLDLDGVESWLDSEGVRD